MGGKSFDQHSGFFNINFASCAIKLKSTLKFFVWFFFSKFAVECSQYGSFSNTFLPELGLFEKKPFIHVCSSSHFSSELLLLKFFAPNLEGGKYPGVSRASCFKIIKKIVFLQEGWKYFLIGYKIVLASLST